MAVVDALPPPWPCVVGPHACDEKAGADVWPPDNYDA